jgi:hypothetical protein
MAQYKVLTKKLFKKEDAFMDDVNNEARNGWKVISIGYNEGHISKVVLEKSNY